MDSLFSHLCELFQREKERLELFQLLLNYFAYEEEEKTTYIKTKVKFLVFNESIKERSQIEEYKTKLTSLGIEEVDELKLIDEGFLQVDFIPLRCFMEFKEETERKIQKLNEAIEEQAKKLNEMKTEIHMH